MRQAGGGEGSWHHNSPVACRNHQQLPPEVLVKAAWVEKPPAQWASSSCLGLTQSWATSAPSRATTSTPRKTSPNAPAACCFRDIRFHRVGRVCWVGSQVWRSRMSPIPYSTEHASRDVVCVPVSWAGSSPQHTPGCGEGRGSLSQGRMGSDRPPQTSCGPSFVDHLCNLPLYTVISPPNLGTQILFWLHLKVSALSGHLSGRLRNSILRLAQATHPI